MKYNIVDLSIILCANNHKTGNGTGMGRRTVTVYGQKPRIHGSMSCTTVSPEPPAPFEILVSDAHVLITKPVTCNLSILSLIKL